VRLGDLARSSIENVLGSDFISQYRRPCAVVSLFRFGDIVFVMYSARQSTTSDEVH